MSGKPTFTVPWVVQGIEQGWEQHAGYSSVAFLSSERWVGQRILDKISGRPQPQTLTVDTTSIDTELAGQKIDFIKIDVQGGEAGVLKGSDTMLRTRKIDILYIEWSGDPRVVPVAGRP